MIKASIHIILIISVFLSSGGFWTNSHFCQNKLTNTSFFGIFGSCCSSDVSPCSIEMEDISFNHEKHKDGCCDNKPNFNKLDQNQLLVKTEFKYFEQFTPVNFIVSSNHVETPLIDQSHLKYYSYVPPPIVIDRQVRLQAFLC